MPLLQEIGSTEAASLRLGFILCLGVEGPVLPGSIKNVIDGLAFIEPSGYGYIICRLSMKQAQKPQSRGRTERLI
jgi:hypothetical protein